MKPSGGSDSTGERETSLSQERNAIKLKRIRELINDKIFLLNLFFK